MVKYCDTPQSKERRKRGIQSMPSQKVHITSTRPKIILLKEHMAIFNFIQIILLLPPNTGKNGKVQHVDDVVRVFIKITGCVRANEKPVAAQDR